jgi:hypothetical protein
MTRLRRRQIMRAAFAASSPAMTLQESRKKNGGASSAVSTSG